MNGKLWSIGIALTFLLGCGPKEEGRSPVVFDVAGLVPSASSMPEWTVAEQLSQYIPETLYEYLDGGASQYLSYGFKKLAHIRYAYRGDDLSSITLDVYDMGSPLGAYGIYSSGRRRDISTREWGSEGYRSGTIAVAWKQEVYVHASADDETPALAAMLEQLMAQVTSAVPGENTQPEILGALPEGGFIPHTDRYVGKDLLGHSFVPGGFLANYEVDGRESLLFFSELASEDAAEDVLARWRAYEEERGKLLSNEEEIGSGGFWADDPGLELGVVIRAGRYVAGIWGVPSEAPARRLVGQLVTNLQKRR